MEQCCPIVREKFKRLLEDGEREGGLINKVSQRVFEKFKGLLEEGK